jgi:rhodanese-related sulfurtransferase
MVRAMRSFLLVSVLALGSFAGCSKADKAETTEAAKLPTVTVDQLDTMLASNQCQAVDANGDETRKKMGVIPGAVLLSDSDKFNAAELPTDKSKSLVFYCANTHCGASHEAAEHAKLAGYTNVKVLPAGIAGWVGAGKTVKQI